MPRSGRTTYLSIQPEEATCAALEAAHERVHLRIGEELILHEHQFVMATTLEYVQLPPTLAGYVMGRSSWERVDCTETSPYPARLHRLHSAPVGESQGRAH